MGKAYNHDTELTGMPRGKKTRRAQLTAAKRKFVEEYAKTDNGAEAVRRAYPELKNSSVSYLSTKAGRLLKNDEIVNHLEYQKQKMERLATKVVDKMEEHIQSDDASISLQAGKFVFEQVHGKATQKSISITATDSLEEVLKRLQGN